jgi:hypothetical protein
MRRSRIPFWPLALSAIALAWPGGLSAQFNDPPAPAAYVLQGVTVVQPDGSTLAGVTLVVRAGRIEAMGAEVRVPADAKLLEGDSLYVYPGIFDAHGEADYEFPEVEVDRSGIASWNPPRHVQSFMPHRRVVDYLTASGSDFADQRKSGVVAAAIHPEGRLMPGRGTVLVFRAGADTPAGLVAQPELGPLMTFRGSQGGYPGTLFAVIAFYRQMFEDAGRQAAHIEAYSRDPARIAPPVWDTDMEIVHSLMGGGTPAFFAADFGRDIQRVLKLAREYDFRPIIVGGAEAWKVADELVAADVPVLVSLDFPKPERWEPKEEEAAEEEERDPGVEDTDNGEEPDAAALREKQRLEDIYANAGRLAAAGVRFTLTSGGGNADILEQTRKAIDYGLSEQDALLALTATPASMFGLDHYGRVRTGGSATFVVTDGPLFAEGTSIRYTFVDGSFEKGKEERAIGDEEPAVDMTGTWDVSIDAEGESIEAKMTVEQKGAEFEGTMTTPFGMANVRDGVVSGTDIAFSIVLDMGGESMVIEVTGTIEGDRGSGSGDGPTGSFTWMAKRSSGPGEEN